MRENKRIKRVKSQSEPDLLNTAHRHPFGNATGFPPGTTVDELFLYRKKRSSESIPRDQIQINQGTYADQWSEYKRQYGGSCGVLPEGREKRGSSSMKVKRPSDHFKFEGDVDDQPEYNRAYVKHQLAEKQPPRRPRNSFQLTDGSAGTNNGLISEIHSKYVPFANVERSNPIRRPNNLKLEGDLYAQTEKAEQFVDFLFNNRRPQSIKLPVNTLRLEGEMERETETHEQYRRFDRQERPPLCKKNTNLHLEGDLNVNNAYVENYPRHAFQKRPALTKHDTNLRMSGDFTMTPEYRDVYVEYKSEKQRPSMPKNNLVTDGFFRTSFEEPRTILHDSHHRIPFLRESRNNPEHFYQGDGDDGRKSPARPRLISRPPPSNLKPEGRMDGDAEYKSAYVNFPRERPSIRRPAGHLVNDGHHGNFQSEKSEKYVSHANARKASPLKRDAQLKLEGDLECQPEYRKAYIDYIKRERIERKPRPIDNLETGQRRRVFDDNDERIETAPTKNGAMKIDGIKTDELKTDGKKSDGTKTEEIKKDSKAPNQGESLKSATKATPATTVANKTTSAVASVSSRPPSRPKSSKKPSTIESSDVESNYTKRSTSSSSVQRPTQHRPPKKKIEANGMETRAFGAKVQLKKPQSRAITPTRRSKSPAIARHRRYRLGQSKSSSRMSTPSDVDDDIMRHVSREGKKYRDHVSVEDLAYKNPTMNPIAGVVDDLKVMRRKKAADEDDVNNNSQSRRSRAFVVLESDDVVCDRVSTNLYKEQKWMPSWYKPSV